MTYEVLIGDDAEGQMSHLPCKEAPFVAGMCGGGGFAFTPQEPSVWERALALEEHECKGFTN